MTRLATRLVLFLALLCFVASICDGQERRAGRARRGAGWTKGGKMGYLAQIFFTILGIIVGIIIIGTCYLCCRAYICPDSSDKTNNADDAALANNTASTRTTTTATTATRQPLVDATTNTYANDRPSYRRNDTISGVPPPSYESVIELEAGLPYSSRPQRYLPMAYSSYPASPPQLAPRSVPGGGYSPSVLTDSPHSRYAPPSAPYEDTRDR